MAKKTGGQYFAGSKSQSSIGRGEYYQPTAIIDKKSGEIWRDAVASVGKSVATIIDKKNAQISEKKKRSQDLMDRTAKYALEKGTQVFDNLQTQGVDNPSIINAWQGLLTSDVDNYRNSISAGTPEEQKIALENMAKTQKQMGQMSTLIDQSNESQTMYDKDVQSGNLLGQGTLNLSGEENMEWAKMMNIRAGTNKGTETWGLDEDGDWTVTFEGDELDGAVTKKAAMFFGYDPGTIPEVDKFFSGLFQEVGATDKNGKPTDKFLDPNNIIQGTNDPKYNQVAYNVRMDAVANATSQQTIAYAKSIAGSLPEAEATWDNAIPEDIKQQVAEEFGVENYSDLQPGAGFGYGQLDKVSGQMFEKAMLLYGGTKMQNQKLGSVVKVQSSKGSGSGSGGGSGSSSITVPDLIKLTSETPAAQQVEMISGNLGPDSGTSIKFHPENNTIIVTEDIVNKPGQKTGEDQIVYDLNEENPMGIDPSNQIDGVGGVNQWRERLVDLYVGKAGSGSAKARKIRLEYDMIMDKLPGYSTPSSTATKPGFLNL